MRAHLAFSFLVAVALLPAQDFVVRAETVHTMAGAAIENGVVVVQGGKIALVGPAATVRLPAGLPVRSAKVLVPGLIDAHATAGLTGFLNIPHDQDQLDEAAPIQPELRAIDAYNAHDPLVSWLRSFGVTTLHTGHAPRALVAGQTMVVKTHGRSVEKDVVVPFAMVACTLGDGGRAGRGDASSKKPGTRAKSAALLRQALIEAREYVKQRESDENAPVQLRHEALAAVLRGEARLLVTAHRAHDITTTLRIEREFSIQVVLDGVAEAYLLLDELAERGRPVLPHPPMARTRGELGNATMELPRLLAEKQVPFAMQSGFESYVPKSRVVLFEAGVAVGQGLTAERALRALTIDAARLLGIAERTGSLEVGKDADLAWYDGDPFRDDEVPRGRDRRDRVSGRSAAARGRSRALKKNRESVQRRGPLHAGPRSRWPTGGAGTVPGEARCSCAYPVTVPENPTHANPFLRCGARLHPRGRDVVRLRLRRRHESARHRPQPYRAGFQDRRIECTQCALAGGLG